MVFTKPLSTVRGIIVWSAVFCVTTMFASPAHAIFHFWNLQEIYTNSSGTLQFIELHTTFGSQQSVNGQQINVSNIGNTMTNMFTLVGNLPGDSAGKTFLIGTAGIEAAGGPEPDYTMPDGFLFQAGGSIAFFGANSGSYSALPTDGAMSRIWGGGNNLLNSPKNFDDETGFVAGVPEPTTMILTPLAVGVYGLYSRLSRRRKTGGE